MPQETLTDERGRLRLPTGQVQLADVQLADGRWLRYAGLGEPATLGAPVLRAGLWHGPAGLVVVGSYERLPEHGGLGLHLSVSYPDRYPRLPDLRAVGQVFFLPGASVEVVSPAWPGVAPRFVLRVVEYVRPLIGTSSPGG